MERKITIGAAATAFDERALNARAMVVLQRVQSKLDGTDAPPEAPPIVFPNAWDGELEAEDDAFTHADESSGQSATGLAHSPGVAMQVDRLIFEAQSHSNLCQLYWCVRATAAVATALRCARALRRPCQRDVGAPLWQGLEPVLVRALDYLDVQPTSDDATRWALGLKREHIRGRGRCARIRPSACALLGACLAGEYSESVGALAHNAQKRISENLALQLAWQRGPSSVIPFAIGVG